MAIKEKRDVKIEDPEVYTRVELGKILHLVLVGKEVIGGDKERYEIEINTMHNSGFVVKPEYSNQIRLIIESK